MCNKFEGRQNIICSYFLKYLIKTNNEVASERFTCLNYSLNLFQKTFRVFLQAVYEPSQPTYLFAYSLI